MNAYLMYDRAEAAREDNYYRQVIREERESELTELFEKQITDHLIKTIVKNALTGTVKYSTMINAAFNDDDFMDQIDDFRWVIAGYFAHQQVKEEMNNDELRDY